MNFLIGAGVSKNKRKLKQTTLDLSTNIQSTGNKKL